MKRSNKSSRSFSSDQLHAAIEDIGGPALPDYLPEIVGRARRVRQRPAWTFLERWLSVDVAVRHQGVPRAVVVSAALSLLVPLLLAGAFMSSSNSLQPGFATGNGLIAFAADAGAGDDLTSPVEYGDVETTPERMDIYVTRPGEPTRVLIATDAHERCPAFSPDGRYLAYVELGQRVRSVAPSIVIVRVDASGVLSAPELRVSLPPDAAYERKLSIGPPCPQWSPDGSQIAYMAIPHHELRVSTLDGQERVIASITPSRNGADMPFAWKPEGDAIAYTTTDGVWSGPLDGSAPSLVWRTDGRPISVSWSPRGELAITVSNEQAVEGGGSRDVRSVHVVDVDTGSERSLDTIHDYDYGATWSPDGSRLAFVDDNGDVRLCDRSDGSMTTLSPAHADGPEMHFWDVAWSPDGERLLALARSDIGFALVSLSQDGASADVLTPWTWAMDWINLQEVSWQPTTN